MKSLGKQNSFTTARAEGDQERILNQEKKMNLRVMRSLCNYSAFV